ncbi:MAG: LytR C-terminal domain-containing protein [Actinobacteria bacterium]|nr:LytR C-terminal domain-containing protein [Actinomycetota bacterium]
MNIGGEDATREGGRGDEANLVFAVEHSLSRVETPVAPWRTATLVASAIAALELVVLVIAAVALLEQPVQKAAKARVFAPVKVTKSPPIGPTRGDVARLSREQTSVIVLNGNGRTGAAATAADRVRARGYKIGTVGNAKRSDYSRTLVMYRRGHRGEAARLARDLRIKVIGPLDGISRRDLFGAHVALVVGN